MERNGRLAGEWKKAANFVQEPGENRVIPEYRTKKCCFLRISSGIYGKKMETVRSEKRLEIDSIPAALLAILCLSTDNPRKVSR